jgi:outer membrane protein assembly factor BamB
VAAMTGFRPLLLGFALLASACGSNATTPSASPASSVGAATQTATATAAATPTPSPSPTVRMPADWPVYQLDPGRTGYQPDFPAFGGELSAAWSTKLDGAVYAEPLVVHGRVIAATEGDSVYALDPRTGAVIWRQNLGSPVPRAKLPCGNINPLGITGTPAYDPATGSIFMVAEVGSFHHTLFALDADTGAIRWARTADLTGDDPRTHQQRPAMAVANGYVYIGLGGLAGDCGQYVGEVVGIPTDNQGPTIFYRVPVQREGAVWATGGPVVDGEGNLYVSTGNGSSTHSYDGSDSVLELSPNLLLISRFSPKNWAQDNARDADLGSLSPAVLPNGFVFIAGKNSTGYVLRQGSLGGIGGQVSSVAVGCRGFGSAAHDGDVVYLPCPDGGAVRQVNVAADGSVKLGWQGKGGGPTVIGGGVVWSVDYFHGGVLYALDPATGATRASFSLGAVPHFATPTLWDGLVLVGTSGGVVAVETR